MAETFGQRLSRLRREKGLTQEDIAKRIIISPQAVSKWENDISSPDILVLSSLADILGVSVDQLLGREDIPEEEAKAEAKEEPVKEEKVEIDDDDIIDEDDEDDEDDDDEDDDDDESTVHIGRDGIHVTEKNGEEVHIDSHGIRVVDSDGKTKKEVSHKDRFKEERGFWITSASLFGLALIGFVLMGILWTDQSMGWRMGWILFLFPWIISSFVSAIQHRTITRFAYPILVVAAYCTLGFLGMYLGFEGWGYYWFLFITIPAFYLIFGPIDNYVRKNRK